MDSEVLILEGELLMGVIDKNSIGNTKSGGITHVLMNDKGPEAARMFLGLNQRMVNYWLMNRGFSVGLGDMVPTPDTMHEVMHLISSVKEDVTKLIQKGQHKELEKQPGKTIEQFFEWSVNSLLNTMAKKTQKEIMKNLRSDNSMQAMALAGSKGSPLNLQQISGCVGQQNVDGKRIAYGFRYRTLPHFCKDDLGADAHGFVVNSYLKGLTPQEFYFHAMGGREGIIDTAVKTSKTGYIQRRLIKSMEDLMVYYDGTVRNSRGQIVQFLYGEDGMDARWIEDQSIPTLHMSIRDMVKNYHWDIADYRFGYVDAVSSRMWIKEEILDSIRRSLDIQHALDMEYEQLLLDRRTLRSIVTVMDEKLQNINTFHLPVNIPRLIWTAKSRFHVDPNGCSDISPEYIIREVNDLLTRLCVISPETGMPESQDNAKLLFSIFARSILASKSIMCEHRLTQKAFDWLLAEVNNRFMKAQVSPGEVCGIVAAQSIGEPATQMTLNTFHFAGVSEKNVTLGVPRLEEIINVVSNISTPTMTLRLRRDLRQNKEEAERIQNALGLTTLNTILASAEIYYDPDPANTVVSQDAVLVKNFFDTEDLDPQTLSPWMLRLALNKQMVVAKKVSPQVVAEKIKALIPDMLSTIASNDNDNSPVIQIRLLREVEKSDSEVIAGDELLKSVLNILQTHLVLFGTPGIDTVYISDETINELEEDEEDESHLTPEERKRKHQYEMNGRMMNREWVLLTDGTNLRGAMMEESLDFTKMYTNDIKEIFEVLGIEAARRALMKEIRTVISFDGSYVNHRHLSILCDVMTYKGFLMPITRNGINRIDASPLQKASYEETQEVFMEAAVFGEKDRLLGVSENVMTGQFLPTGTGVFDVYLDTKKLAEAVDVAPEGSELISRFVV